MDSTAAAREASAGDELGTAAPGPSTTRSQAVLLSLIIGAIALVLLSYMFSPRYAMWKGLGLTGAMIHPEVNRAHATLQQLADPGVQFDGDVNRVLNWRVLLPTLGHHLGMSPKAYLALPMLGCLATLAYIGFLLIRSGQNWRWAIPTVVVLGGGNWLFVSLGWLSYFDSWIIGALLLTAMTPRPALALIAALVAPWIDERYVLAAPLAIAVAWHLHLAGPSLVSATRVRLIWKTALVGLAMAGYVTVRLVALAAEEDASSSDYADYMKQMLGADMLPTVLWGLWEGPRLAWVFIAVFLYDCWKPDRNRRFAAALSVVFVLTAAVMSVIATDLSRSSSVLLPTALGGALIALRDYRAWWGRAVLSLAFAALIVPATHVLTHFHIGIYYLPQELHRLEQPPQTVDPQAYYARGHEFYKQGRYANAIEQLHQAIRLAPDQPSIRLARAWTYLRLDQPTLAAEDLEAALGMGGLNAEEAARARQTLAQLTQAPPHPPSVVAPTPEPEPSN